MDADLIRAHDNLLGRRPANARIPRRESLPDRWSLRG